MFGLRHYLLHIFLVLSSLVFAEEKTSIVNLTSEQGHFDVAVVQKESLSIGQFLSWEIIVRDRKGDAVFPAQIGVSGGMPAHRHGLPTQPQVSRYLGEGKYLVEGLKFGMSGEWVVLFGIQTPANRDVVRYELQVSH